MAPPHPSKQKKDYGTPVKTVARHMLGLFAGQHGGKAWRRMLSTESIRPDIQADLLIEKALLEIGSLNNYDRAA